MSLEFPIDENGLLLFKLSGPDAKGHFIPEFTSRYESNSRLVKNIMPLTTLEEVAGSGTSKYLVLKINNQPFAEFSLDGGQVKLSHSLRKLSVFETRIIGRMQQTQYPCPVDFSAIRTPITDLHTHLSAQVAASDLIRLGKEHTAKYIGTDEEIYYPKVALDDLGVEYVNKGIKEVQKREFLPLAHLQPATNTEPVVPLSSLTEKGWQTLEKSLSLSPEGQFTYEEMEKCYYLREPFTKDIRLLEGVLRAIAKRYQADGIQYAELCSNAILDPEWLAIVHKVVPEIETETRVKLRFKAGLPRNLNTNELARRIEQYKRIAASPFVIGPDLLGYEINKTSAMHTQLNDLASWMSKNQPDDVMQIHAGENAKNTKNVIEALQLAHTHNIRLDVGHALYGMGDETLELSKSMSANHNLIAQLNLDANFALNNIDWPKDVPIRRFATEAIPFMLGSDGADLYRTNAKQMAIAAAICGMNGEDFKTLREREEDYITRQQAIFDKKMHALPPDFIKNIKVDPKPPTSPTLNIRQVISPQLQRILGTKRPILLAGVGGERSWSQIPPNNRQELADCIKELLNHLDPSQFYFVRGRTKEVGVNAVLEKAILEYNAIHGLKFECVTLLAERDSRPPGNTPNFYTYMVSDSIMNLPSRFVKFISDHHGLSIFAGGKSFTRDFILLTEMKDIPCALFEGMGGASQEKASVYPWLVVNPHDIVKWVKDKLIYLTNSTSAPKATPARGMQ